jgi:O-antigen/teichoic acid export membrane protein
MRTAMSPRLVMLVAFGLTSMVNYGFGVATGWLLSPGDYGVIAFAQSILLVCGLALEAGIPRWLVRAVAGLSATQRAPLVRGALLGNGAVGLLGGGLVALFFLAGPLQQGFETLAVAALVAVTLPMIGLVAVARGVAQADQSFVRVGGFQVAEFGTRAIVGVGLVLLGGAVTGAVAGYAVGAGLAAVLGIAYLVHESGLRMAGPIEAPSPREVGAIVAAPLGVALLLNLHLIAVKLLSGGDRTLAGLYQAATLLANAPYYVVASAIVPVLFADLASRGNLRATRERVAEALGLVLVVLVPLEIGLAIVPDVVLALVLPAAYAPAAPLLRLLAVGNAALMLFIVLSTSFEATGRASVSVRVLGSVTVAELGVLVVVVPTWQAHGAALVFAAACSAALMVLVILYVRAVGLATLVGTAGWLSALARPVIAAGALGILAYAAARQVVVAAGLAALTYAFVAWCMRRRLFRSRWPATRH